MKTKLSVLVIDDENDLCELIKQVLKKEGFDVECAFSLAEAHEKLVTHPDIVLLDNNLPDGSGLEYIQMYPVDFMQSYVVMISADPSLSLRKRAATEGIRAFLEKPFSILRMKQVIAPAQFQ